MVEIATGKPPKHVKFGALYTPTQKEVEEQRKIRFEADRQLWEMDGLDALQIIWSRIQDGTLGIDLPEALVKQIESKVTSPKADDVNTLEVSITDVPYAVTQNEVRASKKLAPNTSEEGSMLLARVKALIEKEASSGNTSTGQTGAGF
jgi:hypothetical protein